MNPEKAYELFFSTLINGDIESTVRVAYDIFHRPIIVLDNSYQIVSLYPKHLIGENIFDAIYTDKKIPLHMVVEFQDNFYITDMIENDKPYFLDWGMVKEFPRIVGRFGSANEVSGYIGIVYMEHDFTESDLEIAQIFCNTLSIQMRNNSTAQESSTPLMAPFLDELYQGKIQNQERLKDWLRVLPFSINKNFCIVNAAQKKSNKDDKAISPYICKSLTELCPGCLTFISGNNLIILLSNLNKESDILNTENSNIKKALALLNKCNFQCGISFCFYDLLNAPQYLQQAQQALKVGRMIDKEKAFYSFYTYAHLVVAQNLLESTLCHAYLHPCLKRIYLYDQEYDTEYFNTLIVYFKNFKEKNKASEELNIHRNTLNYRLQKIEEIARIDLSNPELSYYLLTNIYMISISKNFII